MKQDKFKMDSRSVEDIQNQMKALAAGYVPEWNFSSVNPDIGSVLALIFANQMGRNVNRFNDMLERYRTELINLMEISPMPARPAQTTVLLDVATEAEEGVAIAKGSKFLADTEDEKIVFESAFPVYLTPSRLRTIFMTSGISGRVLPIKGDLKRKNYIEDTNAETQEEDFSQDMETDMSPFSLFRFAKEGLERQAVVLYHSYIFDVEEEVIYCKIEGAGGLLQGIEKGDYRFLYYTEEGFLPVESCYVKDNLILLEKQKANLPVEIKGNSYSVFVLEAKEPQKEAISMKSISFSSAGLPKQAEYVGNGTTDYAPDRFQMFGNTLSLFSECYIGANHYFSKKDAKITLKFHASFMERYVGFSRQEEEQNLKIIKRRPRAAAEVQVSYAKAEEISIEYFNGIGWRRLECDQEYRHMFMETQEADYTISFTCPKDWETSAVGSYEGRALRIQLLRADNCYFQPCFHQIPIISNLKVSYSYENTYEVPERGKVFSGTHIEDITEKLLERKSFTAFSRGSYEDTALYLGFDRKFEQGPISLWWQVEGTQRNKNYKLRFYYSTIHGFKEIKVIDYTAGLTRSGIMMFLPPADMAATELEGSKRYWLKVVGEEESEDKLSAIIRRIEMNGVTVYNIETLETQEFYLDDAGTSLIFPLGAEGILDAEVWVNEKNEFSQETMERMASQMPDKVRLERNYLGGISEFYVKWEETDQFYHSGPEDRHYILDRMNSRLLFGNGVQVKVPQNTEGVAFTVQLRCCNGNKGNVEAGTITESSSNWLFVQDIRNPQGAYGGSDMESMERVLQRGAAMFSSRGRFVTARDYEREVLHFSDNIDKVAIINGIGKDGSDRERMLNIVLLMKDCMKGRESFYRMQDELKEHLLKHCELSIASGELQIEEPVFVELNVDVWVSVMKMEDSFDIQSRSIEMLNEYLSPVANVVTKGWEIGVLPRKSQIMMRLNSIKSKARIKHMVVTARYEDSKGSHEVDLDEIQKSPYMVVMNGTHHIHISAMEDE